MTQISEMQEYFDRLWPLHRSITGEGLRKSLRILKEIIPLNLSEVASGTQVFDWKVPMEWNIEDAYLLGPSGEKVIDFQQNNLHVVNYSEPVNCELSLDDLNPFLHSISDQPTAIPYVTSYYKSRWGFCLSENQRRSLVPGRYKAVIDSTLHAGSLTYGDCVVPSTENESREILISTYLCHPSMGNNELTGPLLSAFLYRKLAAQKVRRFNYRFVIAPETIGALAYLSKHGEHLKKYCHAGFIVTCCGTDDDLTYKRSRRGDATVDRCTEHVLKYFTPHIQTNYSVVDFFPEGSDERQYCSPGFNLPVGSLMRAMYGTYPEYHTSLDDKDFISLPALVNTIEVYMKTVQAIEANHTYLNTKPYGEPQLGSRGLYPTLANVRERDKQLKLTMYILNFSDGEHDLCAIAEKAGAPIWELYPIAEKLRERDLLRRISTSP